jgi:hypothetical protein
MGYDHLWRRVADVSYSLATLGSPTLDNSIHPVKGWCVASRELREEVKDEVIAHHPDAHGSGWDETEETSQLTTSARIWKKLRGDSHRRERKTERLSHETLCRVAKDQTEK